MSKLLLKISAFLFNTRVQMHASLSDGRISVWLLL